MILARHPSVNPKTYEGSKVWESPHMAKFRDKTKQYIGYWVSKSEPELPDPLDFVDNDWDSDERAKVVAYLQAGETFESWRGSSWCRFEGIEGKGRQRPPCTQGQGMGYKCLTDGTYVWPQGFAHYIECHGVKPPQEFIDHVRRCRGSA